VPASGGDQERAGTPAAAAEVAALGARLRRLRQQAGLSREQLAERAGVSVPTILALELGRRRQPYPHTLGALATALGLAPADREALLAPAVEAPAEPRRPAAAGGAPAAAPGPRLPVPPTPLVGREAEVARVRALLEPGRAMVRLLVLVGPGGVGKTRLALAAAAELAAAYADGVDFVDLAPVRDERLVPATIARALGLREAGGRSARELVLEHLRDKQLLLVLDNFEHLPGAAPLLAEPLTACPRLALLVTSRAALRLRGEHRFVVPPLAAPAADQSPQAIAASPAVRLFVDRARAVAPDFGLEAGTGGAVAAICRRLDGLPLAIELAAARAGLLGPAALLRRLGSHARAPDKSRGDAPGAPIDAPAPRQHPVTEPPTRGGGPLSLLTAGPADAPERQRTLRDTLAWSHDLLDPGAQRLFRRLAVFAGGWTLEAAEAVCASAELPAEDVLDHLQVLVDSSLVRALDGGGGEPRFGLLETVREYALEQLEACHEVEDQCGRHAAYFLALAEQAEPQLSGADQWAWLERLDRELDNVRAALAWARSAGQLELGLRLAVALALFWEERGHVREGGEWLETLMRGLAGRDEPPQLATLQARALATTAWLAFMQGDYRRAGPLAEQSLARWRQLGRVGNSPLALNTLAFAAHFEGDLARQEALFQQSLALCRAQGDTRGSAAVLGWLGTERRASGDLDAATALLEESLGLYQATGTIGGIAWVLLHLGGVAAERGEAERARALFERSLASYQSLGDRSDVAYATGALAGLAAGGGELERARALCQESVATFRQLGDVRGLTDELRLLGRIATLQGDDRGAAAAYAEYLTLSHAVSQVNLASSLEELALALARIAAHEHQPAHLQAAVRLLGAAAALREELGAAPTGNWSVSLPARTQAEDARQVAATRAALGEEAFETAWREGQAMTREQALAYALEQPTISSWTSSTRAAGPARPRDPAVAVTPTGAGEVRVDQGLGRG
jgi:predicted ATPase/DNA-binding XRE family transcriptional regulator